MGSQKIIEKVQQLDMFGKPIQLRFAGSDSKKTNAGLIMTLFVLIITFWSFASLLTDLYAKQNANVFQQTRQNFSPEVIDFLSSFKPFEWQKFGIGINVANIWGEIMINSPSKTYYTVEILEARRTFHYNASTGLLDQKTEFQDIGVQYCDEKQMVDVQDSKFEQIAYQSSYCVSDESYFNKTITLSGSQLSSNYSRVQARVRRCNNETAKLEGITCASQLEIETALEGAFLIYLIPDQQFDVRKPNNPYSKVMRPFVKRISYHSELIIFSMLQPSFTYTEENFWYVSPKNMTNKVLEYSREEVNIVNNVGDDIIAELVIGLDNEEKQYIRTYGNILNILGQVGGLFNLMISICSILVIPFQEHYFKTNIMRLIQGQSNVPIKAYLDKISARSLKFSRYYSDNKIQINKLEIEEQAQSIVISPDPDAKADQQDYSLDCQLQKQFYDDIKEKMDIVYILKLIFQFDTMKDILFEPLERKAFEALSKPKTQQINLYIFLNSLQELIGSKPQMSYKI